MSRHGRSSEPNLAFFDDNPRPAVQRWDRDRLESHMRMRSRGPAERDSFRFEERDRSSVGHGREQRDFEFDERIGRSGPRGRVAEKDRLFEEERFTRGPRRPDFLDRDEPTPSEIASRALAPYRRKSVVERDLDPTPRLRPARPQFLRRQSSLDTFDRKPLPRYNERDRDDFRIPPNVPVPLPIRRPSQSRRRRSPPRDRYVEEDFEEIKYRDLEPEYGREEDYRDVHIRRERSTRRKSKSKSKSKSRSHYSRSRRSSSSSSSSSFTEVSPVREVGKKGRTKMPKRLVHKNAVVQLGLPFEEEDDFIIVQRALEKEQIDEIIDISKTYKESRVTYRYEENATQPIEPPPPPPPPIVEPPPPPPPIVEPLPPPPPPPESVRSSHHHHDFREHSHYSQSVRSASPPRHEVFEERFEESNHIGGPLTVVVPDRSRRNEVAIKDEIRMLESERRALRLEREADRIRETEYEIVERDRPKNVVRIEKDRKGRLALVRSAH